MTTTQGLEQAPSAAADPLARILALLQRRISLRTESQAPHCRQANEAYLRDIAGQLQPLGFTIETCANPASAEHPLLIATRRESAACPTVLLYGHGDVQFAHSEQWADGLNPWQLTVVGERAYGRGTADNKGQHTINFVALEAALASRAAEQHTTPAAARLGFNITVLMETAEEVGSLGLDAFAGAHAQKLRADLFLGSDGPRFTAEAPTIFLGSRGSLNIRLTCTERAGAHHSGNWGGKLRNPATVLAAAIAALVDGNGRILIDALRPPALPEAVREAIAALPAAAASPGDPAIDTDWGEPGLSPTERALGFNTLEVLTLDAGTPAAPVNAIPGEASALLQLRFVLGTDPEAVVPAIRAALARAGIRNVEVRAEEGMAATRLSPNHPAVTAAACAITSATGREPAVLPNLGGTIPNAVFSQTLNLPTVWIPHSYPACNQHAPDEHLLLPILAEGYEIMRTIFLDMGEHPGHWFAAPAVPSRTIQEA